MNKEIIYTEHQLDDHFISVRCNLCEKDMIFNADVCTPESVEEAKVEHNQVCELVVRKTE